MLAGVTSGSILYSKFIFSPGPYENRTISKTQATICMLRNGKPWEIGVKNNYTTLYSYSNTKQLFTTSFHCEEAFVGIYFNGSSSPGEQ